MSSRTPHFSQRSSAGEGVADKCVAAVVIRQRLETSGAERLARPSESLAERVTRERLRGATGYQRRQERLVVS